MNKIIFLLLMYMAVHTSGVIRPVTTQDSQQRCGSVLCKTVSELFSESKLNVGSYNFITTIPMGAMNFSVQPLAYNENLLALKAADENYIINGHNRPSKSGLYEYNGDIFDYNHDASRVTAKGPLKRSVKLFIFAFGVNPGIRYEYTTPIPAAAISEEEEMQTQWNELGVPLDEIDENVSGDAPSRVKERYRRKFSWKLLGFGQCSRACGPGTQQPIFRCIRESPTRFYTTKRCAHLEKPLFSAEIYRCNRGLCSAFWRLSEYLSDCKCETDTESAGERARKVECVQEQITGRVEPVAEKHCDLKQKPNNIEKCTCKSHRISTRVSTEKAMSMYTRLTSAATPNMLRSLYNSSVPLRRYLRNDRIDKTGVWLMASWTPQCEISKSCDLDSFEYRSIYCDRSSPYTDLCDLRFTPQQKRACQRTACDRAHWLMSEWSPCNGDCFNLQQQRLVFCLYQGALVKPDVCEEHEAKPISIRNCTQNEVNFCGSKWLYSEWSECSRTCGEGQQRRYAKCLEYDWKQNTLVESSKCIFKEREPVFATCNMQNCEELNTILENVQKPALTTPSTCSDDFNNCKRLNRQRLCKLQYYKIYCCQTCRNYL